MIESVYIWISLPIIFFTVWVYAASELQSRLPTLRGKAVVLLIAHPDDEAMFFAPTVLGLTRRELGNHVQILCLSSGNYVSFSGDESTDAYPLGNAANIGAIRKKEIVTSARILGLRSESDVHVIEDPSFPDSMSESWDSLKIAKLLDTFFVKTPSQGQRKNDREGMDDGSAAASIDVLITFDKDGVSGHPNHQSLHAGAVEWIQGLSKQQESPVTLYRLTSTNMVRKYLGLLDMPFTLLSTFLGSRLRAEEKDGNKSPDSLIFFNGFTNYRKSQNAMTEAHVSQMVWFRWGWIILSRYMVMNDLRREVVD